MEQQAVAILKRVGIRQEHLVYADIETLLDAIVDVDYGGGALSEEELQKVASALETLGVPSRRELWDRLPAESEVKILDEHGVNVENGAMRPIGNGEWLYCDDTDGFDRLDATHADILRGSNV